MKDIQKIGLAYSTLAALRDTAAIGNQFTADIDRTLRELKIALDAAKARTRYHVQLVDGVQFASTMDTDRGQAISQAVAWMKRGPEAEARVMEIWYDAEGDNILELEVWLD